MDNYITGGKKNKTMIFKIKFTKKKNETTSVSLLNFNI